MRANYKLKYHLKRYIKQELIDYTHNKKLLEELEASPDNINSKTILIIKKKIISIEKVYKNLNENEQAIFNIIFKQGCNQLFAQTYYNITKDMYYNAMNKIIFLVAKEYDQI